jgi:hypothetical protein
VGILRLHARTSTRSTAKDLMSDSERSSSATLHELADPEAFAGVIGRSSVDYLLRNTQQQLVALGGQADFKASVMITASSISASIAASQIKNHDLQWAAIALVVFLIPALLMSVVAVYPKFPMAPEGADRLPPDFNPLFFGHYARVPKSRYLSEMSKVVRDDGAIYRVIAADIYDQGKYLVVAKYRFLRWSYVLFILGFFVSGITLVVTSIA